ncbi:MAG: phosphohistidine phosphatase SixA [Nitrososphaerales archaeon]
MEIYLVRHGEARSEDEDPAKSLSERGENSISLVSEHLYSLGLKISKIYHSEKLRAKQSAKILYGKMQPKDGMEEVKGLAPTDSVDVAQGIINNSKESIMIVGHLPHLSRLLSQLIVGDQGKMLLRFDPGSVVCVTSNGEGWTIDWSLRSAILSRK